MAGHAIDFNATGNITSPSWATPQTNPSLQQAFHVVGLTAENTGTGAGTVIIRDGGSGGRIVLVAPVPAQANAAPGAADVSLHSERVVLNGLYVELDGTSSTIVGTIWVR